ncbi:MAG: M28 family peptidase [Bacteroidota bacterium]
MSHRTAFLATVSLLFALCSSAIAQTSRETILAHGRAHAQALAHPDMKGRGYQHEGHRKAADYLATQFEKFGLQAVPKLSENDEPYFQYFRANLNLVQDSMYLHLNGVNLRDGHDYIAKSNTGRGELTEARVRDLGYGLPEDFDRSFQGEVVMFRAGLPEKITADKKLKEAYRRFGSDDVKIDFATKMQAAGVIILKPKLTAGFSPMPVEIPVLEVLEEKLPGKHPKPEKRRKKIKTCDLRIMTKFTAINTQNVIGMIEGSVHKDSVVIVCGHYDHLGTQDEAIFYGGNDNASGTAMLLNFAEHFSRPENRPRYSMAFVGYGGEEAGLLGSRHYVEQDPLIPLANTVFVLNIDLMANGDEGITVVAGPDFPEPFQQLQDINTEMEAVPRVKGRGNAPNSDHYFFVKNGVPAFFIYTLGGPPHYHDVNDTYENMQFSRFYEVQTLLTRFLNQRMGQ